MTLFVPDFVNLIDLTNELIDYGLSPKKAMNCLFLMHMIIVGIISNKGRKAKGQIVDTKFFQANKFILKELLAGNDYPKFMTFLEEKYITTKTTDKFDENGVFLYSSPTYMPGEFSKSYQIKNYNTYNHYDFNDEKMINRYHRAKDKIFEGSENYKLVKENVGDLKLIKTDESLQEIGKWLKNTNQDISAEDFLILFNQNDYQQFKVDRFGRRAYNKLTNLKSSLRKFLRFGYNSNQDLICVDICASQPTMYSILNKKIIETLNPELGEAIPIVEKYNQKDTLLYKSLCRDSEIYEFIVQQFANKGLEICRDISKKAAYSYLFSDVKAKRRSLKKKPVLEKDVIIPEPDCKKPHQSFKNYSFQLLDEIFPNLTDIFLELQNLPWSKYTSTKEIINPSDKGDKTSVSLIAQRTESSLFFKLIIPKIKNKVGKFATIHDSILISNDARSIAIVIQAIEDSFINDLCVPAPKLKVSL